MMLPKYDENNAAYLATKVYLQKMYKTKFIQLQLDLKAGT